MTIPTQMNCAHQGDGWCLECVEELEAERAGMAKEIAVLVKALWKTEPILSTYRDVSDGNQWAWLHTCIVLSKYEKEST